MKYNLKDADYSVFESFSDMILNVCIVLLMLIAILALNVGERLDSIISPSHFSGGVTRPRLYLSAYKIDYSQTTTEQFMLKQERTIFGSNETIDLHLLSLSTAEAATTVKNDKMLSMIDGETFYGQYTISVYEFLKLACGIDPGHFKVAGQDTALLIPEFSQKIMNFAGEMDDGYEVIPDANLALKILSIVWPVFSNRQYPVRSHGEYQEARTKIYVETLRAQTLYGKDVNVVVIGQQSFIIPDSVKDGSLSWLLGFASGLTEIHYLGEFWVDEQNRTNKRIDFFEKKGFIDGANAYREYYSQKQKWTEEHESIFRKLIPWESLPFKEKMGMTELTTAAGTSEKTKEFYGEFWRDFVRKAVDEMKMSSIIIKEEKPNIPREYLPPLVAYPEAWQAYIDYYDKENNVPPQWFFDDFLKPLGFDRRVVRKNN